MEPANIPLEGGGGWSGDVTRHTLYKAYADWCKLTSKQHYGGEQRFFGALHKIFPPKDGVRWKGNQRLFVFGPLDEARAQFARHYQVAKFADLFS